LFLVFEWSAKLRGTVQFILIFRSEFLDTTINNQFATGADAISLLELNAKNYHSSPVIYEH